MRLTHLLVAGTAVLSASALAGGTQQQGAQSPEVVKQAQEKLSAAGHDAGTADGKLGAQTKDALKSFQSSQGLEPSGQLDTQTIAALEIDKSQGSAAAGSSARPSSGATPEQPNTGTGGAAAGTGGAAVGSSPERSAEPASKN
jgi:peptidoglycan hydrolase-like protein with peptidoglycan-binding domain